MGFYSVREVFMLDVFYLFIWWKCLESEEILKFYKIVGVF